MKEHADQSDFKCFVQTLLPSVELTTDLFVSVENGSVIIFHDQARQMNGTKQEAQTDQLLIYNTLLCYQAPVHFERIYIL